MSPSIRTGLTVALGLAASLVVSAAAGPAALEQSKRNVVRAVLQRTGCLETEAARVDAAADANALCEIRLDTSQEQPVVTLLTSGQPAYKAFAIKEENKVVVDLADTVNLRSGTIPAKDEAVVHRVRTSLFAINPDLVSRAVVDLATPCTFDIAQNEEAITVVLKPTGEASKRPCKTATARTPKKATDSKRKAVCDAIESGPAGQKAGTQNASLFPETQPVLVTVRAVAGRAKDTLSKLYDGTSSFVRANITAAEEFERQRAATQQAALLAQLEAAEESASQPAAPGTDSGAPLDAPGTDSGAPLDAYAKDVAERVDQLAEELESVQASQFEVILPPVISTLAAVTEQGGPAEAPSAKPPPAPEPAPPSEAPSAEPPPAPPLEAPSAEPPPAPPAEAPAISSPPPPEKRSEQTAPSGAPVVTRMKELLSGIAEAANGSRKGTTTPPAQVEAAPVVETGKAGKPPAPVEKKEMVYQGNPMDQVVNIDFRDMDLTNVVALLAQKAQINVIAGANLTGAVTASLKNVTLRQAIDTVLRMNNLGIVEEEGIYRIVPYEEAQAAKRKTVMVKLEHAKAADVQKTLTNVLKGSADETLMSLSANDSTNVLIVAGPEAHVGEFETLAKELDISKAVTPTITEAIKVNNAEPAELNDLIKSMLSPEIGKVAIDTRSRHIVVTDQPVVLDQVRELIKQVDMPVKQVSVDAMIIDAVLSDNSETGVDWVFKAVHSYNASGNQIGSLIGPVGGVDSTGQQIVRDVISDMTDAGTGFLSLGLLTDQVNIKAAISAQVDNRNARLLANPVVVTVENQKATINISDEIPYQESKQSLTGPPMVSTAFKEIGILLEVTPKVSHDNHILSKINAKQSRQNGVFNDIPIEAKRTTETTLRTKNGQTIFIGGLRRLDDSKQAKKVPVLGDIPIVNILFRNNVLNKQSSELLVFLTCNVLPEDIPPLDPKLQSAFDELDNTPKVPNVHRELGRSVTHPRKVNDPDWHWRRAQ
jgi:type IV pilus assembly protein PilQ